MITLLASFMLGGWTGTWTPAQPPVQPNSSVGCDPCKGVRTPAQMPNPPQLVCTPAADGNSATLGCGAPPVTGPSWTQ